MASFPRVLFWVASGPNKPSGSPAILAEIVRRCPPGTAEVICNVYHDPNQANRPVGGHAVRTVDPARWLWPFDRGRRYLAPVATLLALPLLVLYGLRQIRRFRPEVLFTVFFGDLWIASSYVLSRLTGIPVVYYVHDPYRERAEYEGGFRAFFAGRLEAACMRHGHVLALTESLREHYAERYGVDVTVLPHLAAPRAPHERGTSAPPADRPAVIGFAGVIYDNNNALMRRLAQVCTENPRLRLRLWTSTSPDLLAAWGLTGERIEVAFERNAARLQAGLADCDLLYLPLGFGDTPSLPSVSLSLTLPTKSIDYLRAGPPILVHCPAHYETARFFGAFDAAYQLHSDAEEALTAWMRAWLSGALPSIPEANVRRSLDHFSPERNWTLLTRFLEAVRR